MKSKHINVSLGINDLAKLLRDLTQAIAG